MLLLISIAVTVTTNIMNTNGSVCRHQDRIMVMMRIGVAAILTNSVAAAAMIASSVVTQDPKPDPSLLPDCETAPAGKDAADRGAC